MLPKRIAMLAAAGAMLFAAGASAPASAASNQLSCHNGYWTAATYYHSIKCQKNGGPFYKKHDAWNWASQAAYQADCNGHETGTKKRAWYGNGHWRASVSFTCKSGH